jgi:hypothetical protein
VGVEFIACGSRGPMKGLIVESYQRGSESFLFTNVLEFADDEEHSEGSKI